MAAHQAARVGIQLVPEDRRIIPGLTVEQNLQLAQIAEPIGWSHERIYEHFPRLGERRRQEGITLSGGEQQMLAIARALARDVKLLLLDEPFEGLAPVIVEEIQRILHEIRDLGITSIIVEQNAVAALELSDQAIILDMGEVVFRGELPPAEVGLKCEVGKTSGVIGSPRPGTAYARWMSLLCRRYPPGPTAESLSCHMRTSRVPVSESNCSRSRSYSSFRPGASWTWGRRTSPSVA